MSGHSSIITVIVDLITLMKTLSDLKVKYEETKRMVAADGAVHGVEVVVTGPDGGKIGIEKDAKGQYNFVAGSKGLSAQQLKKQQEFINKIKQRYAYNKVTDELRKQGYVIAEEEKVQNNTIRLVARKWS